MASAPQSDESAGGAAARDPNRETRESLSPGGSPGGTSPQAAKSSTRDSGTEDTLPALADEVDRLRRKDLHQSPPNPPSEAPVAPPGAAPEAIDRRAFETAGTEHDELAPVRPTVPIERYRIGRELGRGGMGRVVEAFDVQLGRTVALKEILPTAGSGTTRRFAREIHITARLEHASIVPLYDSGISHDDRPYYVMRRVGGRPLDEVIARCRDLDERLTLLPRVLQAIDAVAHAHERGVIHRDLKPQNILVAEHGETVVIDWGLAKVVGERDDEIPRASIPPDDDGGADPGSSLRTQIGSVFGTPGFMAPEQARGEATDLQGDVYALGAVLYQLLAATPPVAGVSATEVMDKTRIHDIRPLAETAPGAPTELVAIVGKALEFDPANRYPDAGALGEDVRRFMAGQLVAAHDYSPWQRLARFARRHRGVLSVLALAAVAVAVMAWVGVHRIVTERDAAEQARREADAGKREAEEARDHLAERHDALIVMQATSRLDASPTEALALIKRLPSRSPRAGDGRAIAQAAWTRGVAWALESTHQLTTIAELDPDATHLLQVSSDGFVRVFDLERRRLVSAKAFAPRSRAVWLSGGKLLVTHEATPPQLYDPFAGTAEPLALAPILYANAATSGERAVIVTPDKTAAIFQTRTRTTTPLAFPEPVEQAAFADDGSWFAVASGKLVVVYDRDGKELTRRVGELARFATSRTGALALQIDLSHLVECQLRTPDGPTWTDIDLSSQAPHRVFDFAYRGSELEMYLTNGDVMAWNRRQQTVFRRTHVDTYTMRLLEVGDETLVVPSPDGRLYWFNEVARGAFVLPAPLASMRLAGRNGARHVVAVGDGVIQVFDASAVMPERIRSGQNLRAMFVGDDAYINMPSIGQRWQWIDVVSRKASPFDYDETAMPIVWDVDHIGGRVLLREQSPRGVRFVILQKSARENEVVVEGREHPWARLVPGDAIVYGLGDGRIFAKIGGAPAKEVVELDGSVRNGTGVGRLQFAAHSTTGEIVRGDLATGALERVKVAVGTNGFLTRDNAGHVLVVEDNRLLVWDGAVTELAKFDKQITNVTPSEGGVVVQVGTEAELYVVELPATGATGTPVRVAQSSATGGMVSQDGKLLASLGVGQVVSLVELPSLARWQLPQLHGAGKVLDVSPTSRQILQSTDTGLAIWHLPHVSVDFGAWLDAQTNATVDTNGVLAWPWQVKQAP